jgi:transcription elongation factor Elf1
MRGQILESFTIMGYVAECPNCEHETEWNDNTYETQIIECWNCGKDFDIDTEEWDEENRP